MSITENIKLLVQYGLDKKLIDKEDEIFIINKYLSIFNLDFYDNPDVYVDKINLPKILDFLTEYAYKNKIIDNIDIVSKDLFDTYLMGVMAKRPSEIIKDFYFYYKKSPKDASSYFYKFNKDINYIREDRIKKDIKWKVKSIYGDIDITINLSKPEKDPKAIERALTQKDNKNTYPKCNLCIENEGYRGRFNHPARQNHRIIPLTINKEKWGFQYSPYVYYNEHCIVLNSKHTPMKIDRDTFIKLFDFIDYFPHYFIGSNADLPIVGGSILTHDHFQGGNYTFPMERASIEKKINIPGYEDIDIGILKWPLSVIRISSKDRDRLIDLADHILKTWRNYTDDKAFIISKTNGKNHNTITPIARKKDDKYELDLVLRNNLTTKDRPFGLYHPREKYHHIKKENIGLIEVMGLAVLPSRLKKEMEELSDLIINHKEISSVDSLKKHEEWVKEILINYNNITKDNISSILKEEIGKVFVKVLEDAGVYKRTKEGKMAFDRFLGAL